jgi:hypothetical protein
MLTASRFKRSLQRHHYDAAGEDRSEKRRPMDRRFLQLLQTRIRPEAQRFLCSEQHMGSLCGSEIAAHSLTAATAAFGSNSITSAIRCRVTRPKVGAGRDTITPPSGCFAAIITPKE